MRDVFKGTSLDAETVFLFVTGSVMFCVPEVLKLMDVAFFLEDPGCDVLCERRIRRTKCPKDKQPVFRDVHRTLEYRAWASTLNQQRYNILHFNTISINSVPSIFEVFQQVNTCLVRASTAATKGTW